MAVDFKSLKKRSGNNFADLQKELEKDAKKDFTDDRFWYPKSDKSGNAYAVIRFLPAPPEEDLPWAKVYSHGFQEKSGWFIENCPTTLGKNCPVCEANSELWNSGLESNKNIARNRKRKLAYYSNILIVKDPENPENEGQVRLFRYGVKIKEKIDRAMKPEFPDEVAFNPFDLWEGADFKLKIRRVEGYVNYDKSEFDSPSAVSDDDAYLESLWNKEFPLTPFVTPDQFKEYAELDTRLDKVLSCSASKKKAEDEPVSRVTKKQEAEDVKQEVEDDEVNETETEDDTDAMSYFASLAEE